MATSAAVTAPADEIRQLTQLCRKLTLLWNNYRGLVCRSVQTVCCFDKSVPELELILTSTLGNDPPIAETVQPRTEAGWLTIALFVVVCMILASLAGLLGASLIFQHDNYSRGIAAALSSITKDHNSVITYSRAWDFAVVKTSALFLAFTLIFVGALYVLRVAETRYALSMEGQRVKGSLETSSPGLVMLTLGVILVGLVLYSKSTVEYHPNPEPVAIMPTTISPIPIPAEIPSSQVDHQSKQRRITK